MPLWSCGTCFLQISREKNYHTKPNKFKNWSASLKKEQKYFVGWEK